MRTSSAGAAGNLRCRGGLAAALLLIVCVQQPLAKRLKEHLGCPRCSTPLRAEQRVTIEVRGQPGSPLPELMPGPYGAMRSGPAGSKSDATQGSGRPIRCRQPTVRRENQHPRGLKLDSLFDTRSSSGTLQGLTCRATRRHHPSGEPTLSQSPQSDTNLYGFTHSMARVI